MLTYRAMYKYLDDGVHAEVLDFPGVITCGSDLEEARKLLASALVDMAETNLSKGNFTTLIIHHFAPLRGGWGLNQRIITKTELIE